MPMPGIIYLRAMNGALRRPKARNGRRGRSCLRTRRPIKREIIRGTVTEGGQLVFDRQPLTRPGRVKITLFYDAVPSDPPCPSDA